MLPNSPSPYFIRLLTEQETKALECNENMRKILLKRWEKDIPKEARNTEIPYPYGYSWNGINIYLGIPVKKVIACENSLNVGNLDTAKARVLDLAVVVLINVAVG
ncbi:hypothetical protein TNIN_41981 [Trichonephila inaurata madagascariensis]|uniref:Uncharacterized protein n=1 Tax=Trichonephila inaurata madagascariensis TaxID=2747483 RepID=A0A8X6MEG3_9ARAC|nr:hypothetical protein TNIN_136661 [Trichonephila inaurata madagascariensis]GFY52113.1 hypothetical protein TNIN_41981 [Trichonephila inaurata madagascariensis]